MQPQSLEKPPAGKFFFHKWTTFAMMYVGYTLMILNRKSFSFAVPAIMADLSFDKDDLGLIASSQNFAYAISKFLGGVVSDGVSSKVLFAAGLGLSGAFTAGCTAFGSVRAFTILWFLQGFVQGGGWPACAKVLRRWFSPDWFGSMWSSLSTAMNLACAVGPLVATYLTTVFGWVITLQIFGILAILVAVISLVVMVDSPTDVGFESFTDKKEDQGTRGRGRGRGTWQDMMKSPFMWVVCSSYLVVFMVRTAALDWAQLYLIEEADQSQYVGSGFISSLETGGFLGTIVAGYVADKLVSMSTRDNTRGTPRMTVVIAFVALVLVALHCMVFSVSEDSSSMWIYTIGFLLGVGLYGPISLFGVMAIEAAPTHLSGTSHAIVAFAANVGAVMAGLPLSCVATVFEWKGAFIFLEAMIIVVIIVQLGTRSLEYKMVPIKKKLQ